MRDGEILCIRKYTRSKGKDKNNEKKKKNPIHRALSTLGFYESRRPQLPVFDICSPRNWWLCLYHSKSERHLFRNRPPEQILGMSSASNDGSIK